MGSKPPQTRKGQQGFPFQTLPYSAENGREKGGAGAPERNNKSGFERGVRMKAKRFILCVALAFLAGILAYSAIQRKHTFTLSSEEGGVKAEQIQPLFRTVRVSGDRDTDVVFTDVETGEKYTIGYITHGMTEKIRLERGRWYSVAGNGNLTVKPINVRVE